MPTTATSELLLPGYKVDEETGAWWTLPWPDDPDERMALAGSSLGPAIIDWSEGRTDEPGLIHYQFGTPWRWTRFQRRFLILWYHVDSDGRFTYRSGIIRGAKGTGKDPMAGAMCNCELLGPVELHDWDERTNRPIGRARGFPLVQVMSNSQEQSKDVLRVANAMWSRDARDFYGLDCGETRTIIKGTGARFEIPPTSEESGEGDPATFVALNETHHMSKSNGGSKVATMARRNVGKSPEYIQARMCEYTNAHRQGSDTEGEAAYRAWQKQQAPGYKGDRDILYHSIEAAPPFDIETAEGRTRGLQQAYLDASWNDIKRKSAEMADARTSVADSIRFYLNGLATEEDAWVEPDYFDALIGTAEQQVVADKDQIALFLDCSKSGDATAMMATRLSDMYSFVPFGDAVWERPHGLPQKTPWLAPRAEVDAKARAILERYDVVWFGIDPSPAEDDEKEALYWREVIDGLHRDYREKLPVWATPGETIGNAVLFDMRLSQRGGVARNQMFTENAMLVQRWINEEQKDGPLRHDGHPTLRQHVHNARNRPNEWGTSLSKVTRDSKKHVDLAVCMVGSNMGARIALNSGKLKKRRSGKATFF
ncbi:terminase [Mycobacterium sp. PSTR-4-N]|uniref:terminase n=1 Tax=Mycobacterium sp. PSTR-4-N TaxID=2917745 RepID=UPI001F153E33|nr:terminase [Mycobacterium sp. PSTR-4-N]MCG7592395.1 terminase [Mycobacterium sp. PSTR-4-N]